MRIERFGLYVTVRGLYVQINCSGMYKDSSYLFTGYYVDPETGDPLDLTPTLPDVRYNADGYSLFEDDLTIRSYIGPAHPKTLANVREKLQDKIAEHNQELHYLVGQLIDIKTLLI